MATCSCANGSVCGNCRSRNKLIERNRAVSWNRFNDRRMAKLNRRVARYKNRAITDGREWGLTYDDARGLLSGDCVYCGDKPQERPAGRGETVAMHGIDRIDSNGGYVNGNVVSCCETCNRAKGAMPVGAFLEWRTRMSRRTLGLSYTLSGAA